MLGMSVKMNIEAWKDEKFSQKASPSTFVLQINPESYTLTHKAVTGCGKRSASGREIKKASSPNRKSLSLNFPLDQSGVMLLPIKNRKFTLTDTIKLFLDVCINVNGSVHTSNYLIIRWGSEKFKCRCESADIKYTLFNPLGKPVRAIIDAKFIEHIDPETQAKINNTNSPDMSHLVTIREGDSLPILCKQIYDDPTYYLQVAKVNKLADFRNLKAGSKILFPRLER